MKRDNWEALCAAYVQNLGANFCDKANAYMQCLHWYPDTFEDQTGLSRTTYQRICHGKNENPDKGTVMALCVGLGLDCHMTTDLLRSAGYVLSSTINTDKAYAYLLLMYHGQGLEFFNRELEARGEKILGK